MLLAEPRKAPPHGGAFLSPYINDGRQTSLIMHDMRVEPHGIGSIMHVIKRGTRGVPVVRDHADKILFLRSLYYLNDTFRSGNWKRDIHTLDLFERPDTWPEREPLVGVLGFTLLPNHFHLLLEEKVENGVSRFMQRIGDSMTKSFNQKYKERGSLFESAYKGKTVTQDTYFKHLVWYILVKNTLECRPGGIPAALKDFDKAWQWSTDYRFSSLGVALKGTSHPIIEDKDELVFAQCKLPTFKKDAKEFLRTHQFRSEELKELALEPW